MRNQWFNGKRDWYVPLSSLLTFVAPLCSFDPLFSWPRPGYHILSASFLLYIYPVLEYSEPPLHPEDALMLPEINCRLLFSAFRNPILRRMWIRYRAAISHRQILAAPHPQPAQPGVFFPNSHKWQKVGSFLSKLQLKWDTDHYSTLCFYYYIDDIILNYLYEGSSEHK